jgi:predicted methyltransferase
MRRRRPGRPEIGAFDAESRKGWKGRKRLGALRPPIFDREDAPGYDAIGQSDRMTLRFLEPR